MKQFVFQTYPAAFRTYTLAQHCLIGSMCVTGLLDDDSPDNEVGLSLLREDGDFMKYAFDLVQQTIATARDHGTIKSIGGLLFISLLAFVDVIAIFIMKDKIKSVFARCASLLVMHA